MRFVCACGNEKCCCMVHSMYCTSC
jgi:hypothetical protein